MIRKSLTPIRCFYLFIVIFFSTMFFLSIKQHYGLKTQLDDLGNIAQPLWNTLNSNFMEMSNTGGLSVSTMHRFGGHANLIYLFFVPIYAVFTNPQTLLFLQVLFASFGALPLYLLGNHYFSKKETQWFSLVGPLVYFLNPILHDAILYDIHAIVVGLPFLTGALYGLLTKRNRVFIISAVLLALCKEDMPLLVFMMGLYAAFIQKRKKFGFQISFVAMFYFIFLIKVFMPAFQVGMPASEGLISRRYGELGGDPVAMIKTAVTNPGAFIKVLNENDALSYGFLHLLGFSLLPLLSPLSLIALPSFVINLLSTNPITSMPFGYYYGAPIIGVFSVSTIITLSKWKDFSFSKDISQKNLAIGLVACAIIFSWWNSPVPFSRVSTLEEFRVDGKHLIHLDELRTIIGEGSSLTVQNNLGPHFIHRQDIVRFPYRKTQSDFVLIDATNPYPILRDKPRQRNFVHLTQLYPQNYYDEVLEMFNNNEYGVVFAQDGFILFEKGAKRDINQEALTMFTTQSKEVFAPLESVAPVNY